jgi:hypothetical protein
LNFLDLLRAGHTDHVINEAALDYMRGRALAGSVIHQLAAHRQARFADQAAWQTHLDRLGIGALQVTPDPVCIATEGALWGSIQSHGLLREMVIVSDDAGQFAVGRHALCWVHAERLVHKLDTFTDLHRTAQQRIRTLIWRLYDDLKVYRAAPTVRRRGELRARFDRISHRRTGFVTLDRLLARLHANKPELLMVLDRPEIPLHTNGSERDIRLHVTKRKISGGTRSADGRDCRDAFLGLMRTAAKLGIAFWDLSWRPAQHSWPADRSIHARSHPLPRPARLNRSDTGFAPVTVTLPKPLTSGAKADGRFGKQDFRHIPGHDVYRCPAGEEAIHRFTTIEHGLTLHKYWPSKCPRCPIKEKCTPSDYRRITRWEHEDVLEAVQRRLDEYPGKMRQRRETAEHPFGTIKARMGASHFLMKTLPRVATEMVLHSISHMS